MSEKKQYGLLCDYKYFSGNHAAEIATKEELGLGPDEWGIKEVQVGPYRVGQGTDGEDWDWIYLPVPTELFSRAWADGGDGTHGDKPLAVQVEESGSLEYGPIEELAKKLPTLGHKAVLFLL